MFVHKDMTSLFYHSNLCLQEKIPSVGTNMVHKNVTLHMLGYRSKEPNGSNEMNISIKSYHHNNDINKSAIQYWQQNLFPVKSTPIRQR